MLQMHLIYIFSHRLDIGDGKEVDLKNCPRFRLQQECIKYLGPVCSSFSMKPSIKVHKSKAKFRMESNYYYGWNTNFVCSVGNWESIHITVI